MIALRFDGEVFRPAWPRAARAALADFELGQVYAMAPVEDRSPKSHRHLFAVIHEVWASLPDDLTARFPTSEHLRKFALIKAGWCQSREMVFRIPREAVMAAAWMQEMDDYAVISVQGCVVQVHRARSMSRKEMKKADFSRVKEAILMELTKLTGADVAAELKRMEAA